MSDFLSKFRNAVLGATMADQPAIMTASGWRLNEKGDYVLDQQNDPHVKLLRDNLAAEGAGVMLGEFGLPAIHGLYNLGVRGLAKSGNNWARAKLINKEMRDIKTPIIPGVTQTELMYLPVKQQSGKTSLKFYKRPESKLTEAERAGIPKVERNQPVRPSLYIRNDAHNSLYTGAAKDNRNLPFSLEDIASAEPQIALNMIRSNKEAERNFRKQYNQILDRAMGGSQQLDDFNSLLLEYIKGLSDPDDMFLNSNGWQSAYVLDYRKYLNNLGYDAADISDYDLAKLISLQYRALTSTMTGKTKGMVMWHGSPEMFDVFDLTKTGNFTGNMGYGGPGNYFSNARTPYGYLKNLGVMNLQPYLINGILSTPSFSYMVLKGLLPKYISPGGSPTEAYTKMVERLVKETPINDSKLYIDDISLFPANTLDPVNKWKAEYMLRRNDGIKSLFPHPSTFVRNADGSVSVRRDWGDSRVNYKSGGKLIKRKNNGNFRNFWSSLS